MMENYFAPFRRNIVGIDQEFESPYGKQKILYADWIASGRLYKPIEDQMVNEIGPFVANTHTETSETGILMTKAYHKAHHLIKEHVNAGPNDVIITAGFGMTAVINKLQRMLGLRSCGKISREQCLHENDKPVVFLTHMEHHSNHTSWFETVADVVVLKPTEDLLVDIGELNRKLEEYKERKFIIGAFTSCSNITGVRTPYHKLARLIHEYGGICIIDCAANAPYDDINMHPDDPLEKLDAILFSPHKFLGGPGSSGVLIFDSKLYKNLIPDNPGGGTVLWTNPWGGYKYNDDIEIREDGGTPGFLQAIRTALSIDLKNRMGTANILKREDEMVTRVVSGLKSIPNLKLLIDNAEERLAVVSFYIEELHYNLMVKLLNDRYGIQVRGGCACAGTYGHFLLDVSHEQSKIITDKITSGDLSGKPGWVRMSLHPTTTNAEIDLILEAVEETGKHWKNWAKDYRYDKSINEYYHNSDRGEKDAIVNSWFHLNK